MEPSCKSSRNLHLQYLAKSQSTPRCQSLITQGSDHPPVLEPHMVLSILGLKFMAQVLKPLRWHKSTLTVAPKPTPMAQTDFGHNLKLAPAAKLFVFTDFLFALAFRKVLFHLKSTPRGTKSTTVVACKVCFTWQSKVDFQSRISKSAPRGTKSTSVFKSHFKVRSVRHKVDFGFQAAF
jgi:hypothetical protein